MNISYVESSKGITLNSYRYWKNIFDSLLKVGTELEIEFMENRPNREDLQNAYEVSGGTNYDRFCTGSLGVASVKTDGSLNYGYEIVTRGRRFSDISLFHEQYKHIFKHISTRKNSNRTGMHQHVMLSKDSYGNSQLETELPDVIYKNIIILVKNYLPEIHWLTSALYRSNTVDGYKGVHAYTSCDCNECLGLTNTVFESYRRYNSFYSDANLKYDFNSYTGRDMYSRLRGGDRYKAINVQSQNAYGKDFHIEFRLPDGGVCASQVAIQNFMWKAIIDTAIRLSLGGELEDIYKNNNINALRAFSNNNSNSTYPNTASRFSMVRNGFNLEVMKASCVEFVKIIAPNCSKKLYNALIALANENISLRLKRLYTEGKSQLESFEIIEKELSEYLKPEESKVDENVYRKIANKEINTECVEELVTTCKEQNLELDNVLVTIERLKKEGVI